MSEHTETLWITASKVQAGDSVAAVPSGCVWRDRSQAEAAPHGWHAVLESRHDPESRCRVYRFEDGEHYYAPTSKQLVRRTVEVEDATPEVEATPEPAPVAVSAPLTSDVVRSGSGWELDVTYLVHGHETRIRVHHDTHYHEQCRAHAEVWSPATLTWNEVASLVRGHQWAKATTLVDVGTEGLWEAHDELVSRAAFTLGRRP